MIPYWSLLLVTSILALRKGENNHDGVAPSSYMEKSGPWWDCWMKGRCVCTAGLRYPSMPPYGGVFPYSMPNYYPSVYAGVPAQQFQPPPMMGQGPGSIPGYGSSIGAALPQPVMVAPNRYETTTSTVSQAPSTAQASSYLPSPTVQRPPPMAQWPQAIIPSTPDAGPLASAVVLVCQIRT